MLAIVYVIFALLVASGESNFQWFSHLLSRDLEIFHSIIISDNKLKPFARFIIERLQRDSRCFPSFSRFHTAANMFKTKTTGQLQTRKSSTVRCN